MSSTEATVDISDEDVKSWMRTDVAREIEELRGEEIPAEHTEDWYRGVLAWVAKYYVPDDPEALHYPDGPGDGGMDIVSIIDTEGEVRVEIYQLSVPRVDQIASGRFTTTRTKYGDDVRTVRNAITGEAKRLRKLNPAAREVLRQINRARELARDPVEPVSVSITITPVSLRKVHPDSEREMEELAAEARTKWSTEREIWTVRKIRDVYDLYRTYQRKRGKDESPERLKFRVSGEVCSDHPDRGPFLCFVHAGDVVEAYRQWDVGLLDSNLRYSLGRTEVNKLIDNELERPSGIKRFHEKNNGIVLICNSCRKRGDYIELAAPQIVNGGQTVHSIMQKVEQLEEVPPEKRSREQRDILDGIQSKLLLSARIVSVSGGGAARPDEIALASNTQNKLSERTMQSSTTEMRDLRLRAAALENPWFVVTKDGEWTALIRNKDVFKSKTGNRRPQDFKVAGQRFRRAENTDLGIAMLAFTGFVDEAKASRVYRRRYFARLFGSRPTKDAWGVLSKNPLEWGGPAYDEAFEPGQPAAPLWLLGYLCWGFWKQFTYPESRQFIMAYEEEGLRDDAFRVRWKKGSDWDVDETAREKLLKNEESCYWVEQVAKSAYLVLVYQTMRLLLRAHGRLDDETCVRVLNTKQFQDLYRGEALASLGDFREGSLSDGPLTAIGRMLHYACKMLWQSYEAQIRQMASRQQVLLQAGWVARLSEKVDLVADRISRPGFRAEVEGPNDGELTISDVGDLLR